MPLGILGTLAIVVALVLSAGPAMAGEYHHHHRMAYTCTGGDIPSGTYASITVTGRCDVPADAVIRVLGNVYVAAGAVLDAQSAPSTITVGHNVTAAAGSLLGLGCQPDYADRTGHPCTVEPEGHSTVTVNGNVTAIRADTVLLNGIAVKRNVKLIGGGGDIPWAIKNDTISGNLTVIGQTADWLGVLFNSIGGNATLIHITVTDPGDPERLVFVVRNSIDRNLNCWGLDPGVSGGFFPGEVNTVGHHATGQCAALV
jgi:hypothetical protein